MASLATIVRGFVGVREDVGLMDVAARPRSDWNRLRPLANEDVYLFVKRIDNTAVVRAADPVARRSSVGAAALGLLMTLIVIAGSIPAAYNTMEGYRIQRLQQEQGQLKQQQATLAYQKAQLLSQENLNHLADRLKMVDPAPQQVQFLEGDVRHEARNYLPAQPAATMAR